MRDIKRLGLCTLALTMALTLLAGCGTEEVSEASENLYVPQTVSGTAAANYVTYTLEPTQVTKDSQLGLTAGYDTVWNLKAQEDLVFQEMLVNRGERVTQGQPLVRLTRNASQAEVLEAELALERTRDRYDRERTQAQETLENFAASGAGETDPARKLAALELEELDFRYEAALDELEQALVQAQAQLEDVVYYAPFDGIVTGTTSYSAGAELRTGDSLLSLSKADSLVLTATSNTDFFQFGMEVTVEYGKANHRKTVSGRVVATDRVLGDYLPQNGMVYIKIDDETLTAEDLENAAALVTTVQLSDAKVVPKSAVETENGESYVQVLENGQAVRRYIQKGVTLGTVGDYQVQVLAGLDFGETIVAE